VVVRNRHVRVRRNSIGEWAQFKFFGHTDHGTRPSRLGPGRIGQCYEAGRRSPSNSITTFAHPPATLDDRKCRRRGNGAKKSNRLLPIPSLACTAHSYLSRMRWSCRPDSGTSSRFSHDILVWSSRGRLKYDKPSQG
jgi:hypothetical protein